MVMIIWKGRTYYVIYNRIDRNGKKKAVWETYATAADAERRKQELESKTLVV